MPSANGVYTLPVGYLAVTGDTIQASQHNPPLEDIAAALTLRLSRDGTAPMTGVLQAATGTAGAPSYTFAGNNSRGFFLTTNGIGVTIGGTQVAELTANGLASGVWIPGMIILWARTTLPSALWVFPVGQTMLRASFPTLWTIAQAEIAVGNTFYNNGDGSTTFGIGDARGRVFATLDNLGGSAAGRLTTAGSGVDGSTTGAGGGLQFNTLLTANLPPYTPAGNVATGLNGEVATATGAPNNGLVTGPQVAPSNFSGLIAASSSFTGTAQGGTSTPFTNAQPTLVVPCILFVGN